MQLTPEMLQTLNPSLADAEVFYGIALLWWLFVGVMLFLIGRKTNTSLLWLAFIPVVQWVQPVRIARKPLWWLVLMFLVPFLAAPVAMCVEPIDPTGGKIAFTLGAIMILVGRIANVFVWTAIAAERGKSAIWGGLAWLLCTSPIGLAYLGLSK